MRKIQLRRPSVIASAVGLGICLAAGQAAAESLAAKLGKVEYRNNCSVCHGENGQGDGPMADQLTKAPPNLQLISKNNNGVFPFDNVYDIIDGRESVRAHGGSDMPVWGDAYVPDVASMSGQRDPQKASIEAAVAGRVLSLVYYIRSIQTP